MFRPDVFDGPRPVGAANCKYEMGHTSYDDAILPNDFFDYNPYRSIISEVVWTVKGQVNLVGTGHGFIFLMIDLSSPFRTELRQISHHLRSVK